MEQSRGREKPAKSKFQPDPVRNSHQLGEFFTLISAFFVVLLLIRRKLLFQSGGSI